MISPNLEPIPIGDLAIEMTKREYFAVLVMSGILGSPDGLSHRREHVAKWSVERADALLAELEKVTGCAAPVSRTEIKPDKKVTVPAYQVLSEGWNPNVGNPEVSK